VAVGAVAAVVLLLWAGVYGARAMRESGKRKNEARARETLTEIQRALAGFGRKYEGYPDTLARLRGGEEGRSEVAPAERARLLETELAGDDFERSGYRFRYQPGAGQQRWAATVPLRAGYRLTAEPAKAGSGDTFYFTDETGTIRKRQGAAAGPDDPVAQ
jgi:hypothetical protein